MGIGDVTGSVPDVVSMALGLSDAMAPDKGFAYNLCTFQLDLREEEQGGQIEKQPTSLATPTTGNRTASVASLGSSQTSSSQAKLVTRPGPVIFAVRMGAVGESGGVKTVVEVGIQEISSLDRIAGVVELRKLEGFDTSLFENLSIEVTAQEQQIVPRGIILIIKGLINPAGFGFAHFVGGVLVSAVASAGRPYFVCKPQFMTQAPPRGAGTGIFGQVIETSHWGDRLEVWTYRAPIFSR